MPPEKQGLVQEILKSEFDENIAWANAANRAKQELSVDPNNAYSLFNLSTAYYHLGKYEESVKAYEEAEKRLSVRMLWYQTEPLLSYQKLKRDERIFDLTNRVFATQNRAFSEAYIIRGDVYLEQGNKEAAIKEYEKAVFYNKNLPEAQQKLNDL